MVLKQISRLLFKQSRISLRIQRSYILGCFSVKFLVVPSRREEKKGSLIAGYFGGVQLPGGVP